MTCGWGAPEAPLSALGRQLDLLDVYLYMTGGVGELGHIRALRSAARPAVGPSFPASRLEIGDRRQHVLERVEDNQGHSWILVAVVERLVSLALRGELDGISALFDVRCITGSKKQQTGSPWALAGSSTMPRLAFRWGRTSPARSKYPKSA